MPIIAISAGPFSRAQEVARLVARELGQPLLGRELLTEVAAQYQVPETRLVEALEQGPSLLGMHKALRARCLAYIEAVLLERLTADNLVTIGLAAHLCVSGVAHLLKVRVQADLDQRARERARRENLSEDRARRLILGEDKRLSQWSRHAFGLEEADASIYDLVVGLGQIEPEQAADIIVRTATYRRFQAMTYSQNHLRELALGAKVRAALIEEHPEATVSVVGGEVTVTILAVRRHQERKVASVRELVGDLPGLGELKVEAITDVFQEAAETMR